MVLGQASRSPRTLRYLIEAWLRDFVAGAPGISSAGVAVQRLLHDSTDAQLEPWRKAQREFRLFDAAHGPATLAELILGGTQPVPVVLEKAGFMEEGQAISCYFARRTSRASGTHTGDVARSKVARAGRKGLPIPG